MKLEIKFLDEDDEEIANVRLDISWDSDEKIKTIIKQNISYFVNLYSVDIAKIEIHKLFV